MKYIRICYLCAALSAVLPGCSVKAVGLWVQHDDVSRSFALSWHRDTDQSFTPPNTDPAARWREGIGREVMPSVSN